MQLLKLDDLIDIVFLEREEVEVERFQLLGVFELPQPDAGGGSSTQVEGNHLGDIRGPKSIRGLNLADDVQHVDFLKRPQDIVGQEVGVDVEMAKFGKRFQLPDHAQGNRGFIAPKDLFEVRKSP